MDHDRLNFLSSIAQRITDYRAHDDIRIGEPDHVNKWVKQFDENFQLPILSELDHILCKTYYSKDFIKGFLSNIISNDEITEGNNNQFWKNANLIEIQENESSQSDFLKIFGETLQSETGLNIAQCGNGNDIFVYIDDAIFSGKRLRDDICKWISESAPANAILYVIVIAKYTESYWAEKQINKCATKLGKNIDIKIYRCVELENKKEHKDVSDVLWPVSIPNETQTIEHASAVNSEYNIELRKGNSLGKNGIFKTDEGRKILEQEFLIKGVKIYNSNDNFPTSLARPLGFSGLTTLGFGSTFVTYRNCPNNAPMVLWAGTPWYPLFPRKQNRHRQTADF